MKNNQTDNHIPQMEWMDTSDRLICNNVYFNVLAISSGHTALRHVPLAGIDTQIYV